MKKYCISLLEKQGSFAYTRKTLEALHEKATEEVARLGMNPIMGSLLSDLLSWKDTARDSPQAEEEISADS